MSLTRRLLFAISLGFSGAQAFSQEASLYSMIPANAKAVIHIDLRSVGTKMSWDEFQQTAFIKQALQDAPAGMKGMLSDPASSGIDFDKGLVIAVLGDPKNEAKNYPLIYGQLANAEKFSASVQKVATTQKPTTIGKMQMLVDNKQSLAWTSKYFVLAPKGKDAKKASATGTKKTNTSSSVATRQLQQWLTPTAKPIHEQSRFMELLGQSGDIHLWINRNKPKPKTKAGKNDKVMEMMNWGLLQQGNYLAGVMSFEQDKLVMQMKNFMHPVMDSLYQLYSPRPLNQDVFKKFPQGQPMAILSFSMSPELILSMMKTAGTEKFIDSLTRDQAIKPTELAAGLNGDFTLAVIKASDIDARDSLTTNLQGLQLFVTASIKNKEKWQPLVDMMNKPKKPKTDEDGNEIKPAGPLGGIKPKVIVNDSFVVLSLSPFAAEKFIQSTTSSETSAMATQYASHSSLFILDMKALISFAGQMSKKKNKSDDQLSKVSASLERFVMYGGNYDGNAVMSTLELQFAKKDENGLKHLIGLVESLMQPGAKKERPEIPEEEEDQ